MATTAELLKQKAAANKAAAPAAVATPEKPAKAAKAPKAEGDADGEGKKKRVYKPRRPASDVLATLEERLAELDADYATKRKRITDHIEKLKNGPRPVVTKDDLASVVKTGKTKEQILADIKAAQAKLRAEQKLLEGMSEDDLAEIAAAAEAGEGDEEVVTEDDAEQADEAGDDENQEEGAAE